MISTRKFLIGGAAVAASTALVFSGTAAAFAHDNGQNRGGSKGGGAFTSLVEDGTITSAQADSIKEALHAQRDETRDERKAEMEAARDAALASLVSAGTLTQAQADAISAADRGGMRELVQNGTVDREDLRAIKDALKDAKPADRDAKRAEMEAERAAVLSDLVSNGTITQAQADAVASAIDTAHAQKSENRGERGKRGGGMRR